MRHGVDLEFVPFESPALGEVLYRERHLATKGGYMLWDFARRAGVLERARRVDAVVLYREAASLGPAFYERLLARSSVPLLLDFDDAIWMQNPETRVSVNGVFSRLRFPGKTRTIARLASAVTVGNEYLAQWARRWNDEVFVVPTSIDLSSYTVQPEVGSDEPFVIGWMGSFSTLVHLEQVRGALERFAKRRRVRFVVVCDRPLEPPPSNVETVFVPWRADREAADIGAMHVGIMPLVDLEVAKGKCGCKALQYMAAGRPAVVAPVGVNVDIVRHGENGLLASTEDEWVDAFERLASSPDLRRTLAAAGRRTVEEAYASEVCANRFAVALERALAKAPARRSHARS